MGPAIRLTSVVCQLKWVNIRRLKVHKRGWAPTQLTRVHAPAQSSSDIHRHLPAFIAYNTKLHLVHWNKKCYSLTKQSAKLSTPKFTNKSLQNLPLRHSVGIYSVTTHNLATVVSARPAPAACFYNPRMPISACAVQCVWCVYKLGIWKQVKMASVATGKLSAICLRIEIK